MIRIERILNVVLFFANNLWKILVNWILPSDLDKKSRTSFYSIFCYSASGEAILHGEWRSAVDDKFRESRELTQYQCTEVQG